MNLHSNSGAAPKVFMTNYSDKIRTVLDSMYADMEPFEREKKFEYYVCAMPGRTEGDKTGSEQSLRILLDTCQNFGAILEIAELHISRQRRAGGNPGQPNVSGSDATMRLI